MTAFRDRIAKSLKRPVRLATDPFWETARLESGLAPLDHALGLGWGRGRAAELFGNWSSGKTMVLYITLAENQRRGGISILGEAEGAFDEEFFVKLGGDPSTLIVENVDTVEELFGFVDTICKTATLGEKIVIGWDGIAATSTKHLAEVGMDKVDMSKPNAMNRGCQLIRSHLKDKGVCLITTNQVREKIGSNDSATHTPGGNAYPFLCSQRVELRFDGGSKGSLIYSRDGKLQIGRWVRGMVVKNKLGPPFTMFKLPIYVVAGQWHPEFDYATSLGIDKIEALLVHYVSGGYKLPDGTFVVSQASGWHKLNPQIGDEPSFYAKGWPDILAKYPILWRLVYDRPTDAVQAPIADTIGLAEDGYTGGGTDSEAVDTTPVREVEADQDGSSEVSGS